MEKQARLLAAVGAALRAGKSTGWQPNHGTLSATGIGGPSLWEGQEPEASAENLGFHRGSENPASSSHSTS